MFVRIKDTMECMLTSHVNLLLCVLLITDTTSIADCDLKHVAFQTSSFLVSIDTGLLCDNSLNPFHSSHFIMPMLLHLFYHTCFIISILLKLFYHTHGMGFTAPFFLHFHIVLECLYSVFRILSKKVTTNALVRTTVAVTKIQGGTKASSLLNYCYHLLQYH